MSYMLWAKTPKSPTQLKAW